MYLFDKQKQTPKYSVQYVGQPIHHWWGNKVFFPVDNKVLYEWCKHDELFKMMAIMIIHDDDYEEGDDYKEDSNT